ncbi:hypothetical protein HBH70_074170 [Parastagonospora nodorum]|nr:hypothetical protein HBH70_074170 [Parastagonospora nodorum]KAH5457665.1 hypothetical protein HBI30_063380 [Parastagonospora nodorum]KAH5495648.1 hypothetical protein HBI31_101830 [Parastagonospora nodorum]KAH6276591.1 hypothetical protein HBI41_060350 [Parastagonospora nodorum]KAH6296634.1 hypothetical protein HBI40_056420 [Parastagonospora nodorum]
MCMIGQGGGRNMLQMKDDVTIIPCFLYIPQGCRVDGVYAFSYFTVTHRDRKHLLHASHLRPVSESMQERPKAIACAWFEPGDGVELCFSGWGSDGSRKERMGWWLSVVGSHVCWEGCHCNARHGNLDSLSVCSSLLSGR